MVLSITNRSSASEIENTLSEHFRRVKWIGEIDLSRDQLDVLACALRAYGERDGRLNISRIDGFLPLTFIASMVFTARYAEFEDDETPAFWRKYAQMVWRFKDADQQFQNVCREHFRRVRVLLEEQYDLYFPHKLGTFGQDVVGGIYTHAIVPSYLEDDFAAWIVERFTKEPDWADLGEASIEAIAARIRGHSSLAYIRKRLRHFIEHDSTNETAARLVHTMALAVDEVKLGKQAEEVGAMLSLVERAIWDQLRPLLVEVRDRQSKATARRASRAQAKAQLAWDLKRHKMTLHVESYHVAGETAPDRLVWADSMDGLTSYSRHVAVYPTRTESGWLVEHAHIPDVQPSGYIAAVAWVDQEDRILGEPIAVSGLPEGDVLFFEMDAEERYAQLVDVARIKDGRYIICSVTQPKLTQARDGLEIVCQEQIAPLTPLAEKGLTVAGIYEIALPATVELGDDRIQLRYRRSSLRGRLEGHAVAGIAAWATPVFTEMPRLRITSGALFFQHDDLTTVRVRLTAGTGTTHEIALEAHNTTADGDDLVVDLNGPTEGIVGNLELTVLQDISRLLPDPLRFALLPPGVVVEGPASDGYYTVDTPPRATILGIPSEQVDPDFGQIVFSDGEVVVEWRDPLMPTRLNLDVNSTRVTLEWNVLWRHAWIEPKAAKLIRADLDATTLQIRGARYEQFAIHLERWGRRPINLDARGTYEEKISRTTIRDLLQDCPASRVAVTASDGRTIWPLFTYVSGESGDFDALPPLVQTAVYTARYAPTRPGGRWQKSGIDPTALLALPPDKLSSELAANVGAVGKILEAMKQSNEMSYKALAGWAFPEVLPLRLRLANSTLWLPITSNDLPGGDGEGAGEVILSPSDAGRSVELCVKFFVHWTYSDPEYKVTIAPQGNHQRLLQCTECGGLLVDNISANARHSHGRGWNVRHHDLSQPTVAELEVDAVEWTREGWSPDLSRVVDREVVRTRIYGQRYKHDGTPDLLSANGYRGAVDEWVRNLANATRRNALNELKNSGLGDLVKKSLEEELKSEANATAEPLLKLLAALPAKPEDKWYYLDRNLLALAIIVRSMARGLSHWTRLGELRNEETLLRDLALAVDACPTLTTWAFALVEAYLSQLTRLHNLGRYHESH